MLSFIARALSASLFLFAVPGWSQEASENKVKVENVQGTKPPAGKDVDEILTNAKMRAESGSKSKYSLATAFSYSGGSIERPLSDHVPNLADATGSMPEAYLGG